MLVLEEVYIVYDDCQLTILFGHTEDASRYEYIGVCI
jgi:hypothetical protein